MRVSLFFMLQTNLPFIIQKNNYFCANIIHNTMNTTNTHQKIGFYKPFSHFGEKLQTAIERFPLTLLSVVAVAALLIIKVEATEQIPFKWVFAGILSAVATLPVYLFGEHRLSRTTTNGINLLLAAALTLLCSSLSTQTTDAEATQMALLMAAFVLAWFFARSLTNKNGLRWWNLVLETGFQLLVSKLFAALLMGGLSLALVSLDQLFGVTVPDRAFQYLAIACFALFMPIYYLSQLSNTNTEADNNETFSTVYPNVYKILGLYILLPILCIYALILYGYLAKIVVAWELPNGWVSWLVSILGFAGLLTMVILHPLYLKGKQRPVALFSRFFPAILFPLLILMLVGIVRRFSDYGITINRLLMLILNLWFIGLSIYLFLSRSKQLKWIPISLATLALLSAVGPWSVINTTERALKKELTQLLAEANWTNTPESQPKPLNEDKQSRLADVLYYLQSNYGVENVRPFFNSLGEKAFATDLLQRLNISDERQAETNYFYFNTDNRISTEVYDISAYSTAYQITHNEGKTVFSSDQIDISTENGVFNIHRPSKDTISISLQQTIEQLLSRENNTDDEFDIVLKGNDYLLIITALQGEKNSEKSIEINHLDALLLLK